MLVEPRFLPWTIELSADFSAGDALAGLVEVLLVEVGPLGCADLVQHIQVMYGLTFSEREVDDALASLTNSDRVIRVNGRHQLTVQAAADIASKSKESRDRQHAVIAAWQEEVLSRHPTLGDEAMRILQEDLLTFLRQICARHGAEVALVLYPRNGSAQRLLDKFQAVTYAGLPDRPEPLQGIRAEELARFLDSPSTARRLFLADLLNAWAALAIMTVDPAASELIKNVAAGQALYADTNYVYRLLNLQGPYEYRAAKEILNLATSLGYEMRVTSWTIEEFRQSLRRARDFINRNPLLPPDLEALALEKASDEDFVAAYWRAHRAKSTTIDDFYEFFSNIEDLLGDLGVSIVDDGCLAVERDVESIQNEVGTIETLLFRDRHPAVKEHDAKYFLLVRRLRGGARYSFSSAGYLYLTCDTLMPRYDREAQRRAGTEELPFAVMASAFLQIVRTLVPRTEDLELSLADIFATPYLRNVGKLSARTTARILGRVGQYDGYTPHLAAKMLVNRTFVRAVDNAPTSDAATETIDLEIVRAAKQMTAEVRELQRSLADERQRSGELERKGMELEDRITKVEAGAKEDVAAARSSAEEAQAAVKMLEEQTKESQRAAAEPLTERSADSSLVASSETSLAWAKGAIVFLLLALTAAVGWLVEATNQSFNLRVSSYLLAAVVLGFSGYLFWGWDWAKKYLLVIGGLAGVAAIIGLLTSRAGATSL